MPIDRAFGLAFHTRGSACCSDCIKHIRAFVLHAKVMAVPRSVRQNAAWLKFANKIKVCQSVMALAITGERIVDPLTGGTKVGEDAPSSIVYRANALGGTWGLRHHQRCS